MHIYNGKEFVKHIKFNNHWYELKSIYDYEQNNFDFNKNINDEFDFNVVLPASDYKYAISDMYVHYPKQKNFDFDKLDESKETTEPKFDYTSLVSDNDFINFANSINGYNDGFRIELQLSIIDKKTNKIIATNSDSTINQHIFKQWGLANEAIIRMLKNIADKNGNFLLSGLNAENNGNKINRFPDMLVGGIPVDLKICINNQYNSASSSNLTYMSAIYVALLKAIKNKESLLNYIKNASVGQYKTDNNTDYDFLKFSENAIMPELKGFILYSNIQINDNKLEYSSFKLTPIIACMKNNNGLFGSKKKDGEGAVSYGTEDITIYNNKSSILNGLPIQFANTIKDFYNKEINVITHFIRQDLWNNDIKLLEKNIQKIKEALII